MTARDMSRAITPGSMEYGDRQQFESNLPEALAQTEPTVAGPEAVPTPVAGDPIEALLAGEVEGQDLPITDGLSLGPGADPMGMVDPMQSSRAERIRQLASQATNPSIRMAARMELRRMLGERL